MNNYNTQQSDLILDNNISIKSKEVSILTQLAAGDHRAMDYMFDNYYSLLCHQAVRYVKDADIAEDIVQDVMMTIWKKRAEIKIESSLKSYLLRCATNRSLNHLRDKRSHTEEIQDDVIDLSSNIEGQIYYKETEKKIMDQINTLSPRCRQIFIMNRFDKKKYKEVAAELEISIKTVEHHIAKALHFLRNNLTDLRQLSAC